MLASFGGNQGKIGKMRSSARSPVNRMRSCGSQTTWSPAVCASPQVRNSTVRPPRSIDVDSAVVDLVGLDELRALQRRRDIRPERPEHAEIAFALGLQFVALRAVVENMSPRL